VNSASTNAEYYILTPPPDGFGNYTKTWRVIDTSAVIDLAQKIGVCSTCAEDGLMETGFEVEMVAQVINLYPKTVDVMEVNFKDPTIPACQAFTYTPTFTPSSTPTMIPTSAVPTPFPTLEPTKMPTTDMPTTSKPTKAPKTESPTVFPTAAPSIAGSIRGSLNTDNLPTAGQVPEEPAAAVGDTENTVTNEETTNVDVVPDQKDETANDNEEKENDEPANDEETNGNADTNDEDEPENDTETNENSETETEDKENDNKDENQAPDEQSKGVTSAEVNAAGDYSETTVEFNIQSDAEPSEVENNDQEERQGGPGRPNNQEYKPADAWAVAATLDERDADLAEEASGAATFTFDLSCLAGLACMLLIAQ